MVQPVNSMNMGRLRHLFCCEKSSLMISNALWNMNAVDKASSQSMDGGLADAVGIGSQICTLSKYPFQEGETLLL